MIFKLGALPSEAEAIVGKKAFNLHRLIEENYSVPPGIVLSARAYGKFSEENGIRTKLDLLIHKKSLDAMRWEELWDLALKIEHLFLQGRFPDALLDQLLESLHQDGCTNEECVPKAVRSSSTLEDLDEASFAGLHNSFVDVRGTASILNAVQQVWASLWTDRSLMFRKELKLHTDHDAMGVLIQDFIDGDVSGVIFTQHPNDAGSSLIETVTGWNDALVSGSKKPERYTLARQTGAVKQKDDRILTDGQVEQLFSAAMGIEKLMGCPQDIEWTFRQDELFILQTRAITTLSREDKKSSALELYREQDKRKWALTLRPSLPELLEMKQKIEQDILPKLQKEGAELEAMTLDELDDSRLDEEISRRQGLYDHYQELYWEYFIPFGHAFRLFGEMYNRYVIPDSPFEFIDLLSSDNFLSIERNRRLRELTLLLQKDQETAVSIREEKWDQLSAEFLEKIYALMDLLGSASLGEERLFKDPRELMSYVAALSARSASGGYRQSVETSKDVKALTDEYLNIMSTRKDIDGKLLIDLAKYSYSLRDNDNLYLGKIKAEYLRSLEVRERRTGVADNSKGGDTEPAADSRAEYTVLSRQLTGAPAVQGIGSGSARLIRNQQDILDFKPGEVIVCSAVDPAITFIVPLASAIVEKRGGMLIHGAIIAREYGIPCVTGVEEADELIESGASLQVDGYLGIVTITDQRTSR